MSLELLLQFLLLFTASASPLRPATAHGPPVTCSEHCPDHQHSPRPITNIRIPPAINPSVDSDPPVWEPMPLGFWYGDWHVAYSSNKKYQALHDLVWSLFPVLPTCGLDHTGNSSPAEAGCPPGTLPGQLADLSTWFTNSSSETYVSAFAYDTPRRVNNASAGPGWVDVWDTVGAGELSYFQQGWEIMAWGQDRRGEAWMVNYELAVIADDTPPCMDILSRVAGGPDRETLAAVHSAVDGLGDADVSALYGEMKLLAFDTRRERLPPLVCGPDCVNNTDSEAAGNI